MSAQTCTLCYTDSTVSWWKIGTDIVCNNCKEDINRLPKDVSVKQANFEVWVIILLAVICMCSLVSLCLDLGAFS